MAVPHVSGSFGDLLDPRFQRIFSEQFNQLPDMLPMLFTYLEAFKNRNIGYASAMGDVLVIAVLLVLSIYLIQQFRKGKAEG